MTHRHALSSRPFDEHARWAFGRSPISGLRPGAGSRREPGNLLDVLARREGCHIPLRRAAGCDSPPVTSKHPGSPSCAHHFPAAELTRGATGGLPGWTNAPRLGSPSYMRSLGDSLAVTCELCHHEAILPADCWPDAVPVRAFRPRIVCTVVGADARPNCRSSGGLVRPPTRAACRALLAEYGCSGRPASWGTGLGCHGSIAPTMARCVSNATGCLTKSYERNSPKRVVPDFRVHRIMIDFDDRWPAEFRENKEKDRHHRRAKTITAPNQRSA
jgi:hypothetical protein